MSNIPCNVAGFIKISELRDLGYKRPPVCVAMAIGLRAVNLVQYKANAVRVVRSMLRNPVPVVMGQAAADHYDDLAIPLEDGSMVLHNFDIQIKPGNVFHVLALLETDDGLPLKTGDLEWTAGAKPDDFALIMPRLLTTRMQGAVTFEYVRDIGGAFIPKDVFSREDLGRAGYGDVLKAYDQKVGQQGA